MSECLESLESKTTNPLWRVFVGSHGVFGGGEVQDSTAVPSVHLHSCFSLLFAHRQPLNGSVSKSPVQHTSTTAMAFLKTLLAFVVLVQLSSTSSHAAAPAAKSCERDCETNVSPICASDGVTYANACLFDQAHCFNSELLPMHYGACSS